MSSSCSLPSGGSALPLFRQLIATSQARRIQVQTNDILLTLMFYDFATDIASDTVVFCDSADDKL